MTEPRYTSPIPPYQAPGPQQAQGPLTGIVVGGPRATAAGPRYVRQKSLLLAGLLALLFPPIGMLYSTVFGTIVMLVLGLPVLVLTAGHGLPGLWPVCVIWAVWAAHRTNQRRMAWAAMGL